MPPILTGPNAVAQPPETSSPDPPPSLAWSFRHDSQQWELVPTRPRERSRVTVASSRTSVGGAGGQEITRRGLGSGSTAATSREGPDGRPSWANVGHLAMLRLDSGVEEGHGDRPMDAESVAKAGETVPMRAESDSLESDSREPRSPRRAQTPDVVAKRGKERHPYKSTAERGLTPTYRSRRSSPPPVPDAARWAGSRVAESGGRREDGGETQRARKTVFVEHLPENAAWFGREKVGRRASFWRYVRRRR